MTQYDIKRLALVLSVQAEIEAMKAENTDQLSKGELMTYGEYSFNIMAQKLSDLAFKHDEQL